jgi:hypothetical protein
MRQKKPNPLLLQSSSPCFVQTQDEHVYFIYIYICVKMRQCRNCGPQCVPFWHFNYEW